ncbi:hypothetical protein ROV86_19285 [Stenotrophomonas pavanii]|uniref:hypothetical protein n=1 Tax=Stenotrophomonas pavanii TaxID=487698 RepID=UPI002894E628|nr:hypothetical protein [Stenotrophomonas pavanii]MDT3530246.1 hypothetical protein [Stenotrophomonas pavanii]
MIAIGQYLVNPAHIIALQADGEAALKVFVSPPVGEISHTCDSPDDLESLRESIIEALNKSKAGIF